MAMDMRTSAINMATRSTRGAGSEGAQCQGWLFKLKENNKEWKKIYVALSGCDIIYYDSPHSARADKRSKDGTKSVVAAHAHDEFDGVRPPTTSPSYFMVETTHAKKTYCARTADEREMWLSNIKRNAEAAARAALDRQQTSPGAGKAVEAKKGGILSHFSNMKKPQMFSSHPRLSSEAPPRPSRMSFGSYREKEPPPKEVVPSPEDSMQEPELDAKLTAMVRPQRHHHTCTCTCTHAHAMV